MNNIKIEPFNIVGISVRTTNENGQVEKDIPKLWEQFMAENIKEKIPNAIDPTIYCVYTDYEKDHTKPYTAVVGYKVNSLESIPEGMTGKEIKGGQFLKFTTSGKYSDNIIYNEWNKIWQSDLPRTYTNDIEIYGEKAQDPNNATVDIFVAVEE